MDEYDEKVDGEQLGSTQPWYGYRQKLQYTVVLSLLDGRGKNR